MKRNKKTSKKRFRGLKITLLIIAIIIVYVVAIPLSAGKNLPGKKAEAEKIAKKFLEESYYYKSIEDFSYFGDCFTNSSYGLIHYTNYYVIYKAKDKRYGDVYLPIAYENLKLLSDGSIVAEEYPYVKTKFLKELFGNIDDMCDSITNGSSAVSGEFSNYFK